MALVAGQDCPIHLQREMRLGSYQTALGVIEGLVQASHAFARPG